jgi:tetratricopeptide (TPR) repeat protein
VDAIKKTVFVVVLVTMTAVAVAQSPEPPLSDSRLSVNTLVREDIFSGLLTDNMERFFRGEKNIDLLLESRTSEKPTLLAWKALSKLYRAVRANENGRPEEFKQHYQQALDLFSKASETGPNDGGVIAVTGGTYVVLADRLPKEYRAAAWSKAYDSYKLLWKFQAPAIGQLPVHLRGELLTGLAQSAQRTGHAEESAQFVDKILEVLAGTPYEPTAKKWKANPASAATTTLTCMTCHDAGRLGARLNALNGK